MVIFEASRCFRKFPHHLIGQRIGRYAAVEADNCDFVTALDLDVLHGTGSLFRQRQLTLRPVRHQPGEISREWARKLRHTDIEPAAQSLQLPPVPD